MYQQQQQLENSRKRGTQIVCWSSSLFQSRRIEYEVEASKQQQQKTTNNQQKQRQQKTTKDKNNTTNKQTGKQTRKQKDSCRIRPSHTQKRYITQITHTQRGESL
jgi:hypothetical protein